MNRIKIILVVAFSILETQVVWSQDFNKRISPVALASVSYKDTYIKVTYGQPAKRKRDIFGKLVPYNEVWRTGANEATEITITREVNILGTNIPAGTYSLFTIPNREEWTIIFNKDVGLWGSYNYNPKQDYHRWTIPVRTTSDKYFENLFINFNEKNDKAELNICWDDVCVMLPISFYEPKK